ncbi:MAG: gamma-glutamyltransferase [Ignavibacteriaceae bacterium]
MTLKSIYSKKSAIIFLLIISFSVETLHAQSHQPVEAKNGMVVSANGIATNVGLEILKKGGNAVDAAVAVGFALAVTYPYAGNLGGGGFMVIHLKDGKNTAIDFREKAPIKATRNMFLDKNGNFNPTLSLEGTTSTGVPGSVAGLLYVLKKYGTMGLQQVIQPAIDLARKGFKLDYYTAESFKNMLHDFKKYPSSFKIFSNNGKPYQVGDMFKQEDLANTLELIKNNGINGFYKGKTAELLVKQIQSLGGYITQEDLEKYQPVEREPVYGTYRGYKIVSMPPSSSGGIALVEMLNVLENFHFKEEDWGSSRYIHDLVETMKYAFADRTKYLGDSDFYPVPEKGLISKKYAKNIFDKINDKATPAKDISAGKPLKYQESMETTHYCVYDKDGNAVSTTTTLNSAYGSKIVVAGAGFLLNNEMDDFSSKPGTPNQFGLLGSEANSIQPQKRMLSSMTPTIILKDNKPYLIIGSPGGSTIITVVLQLILNCIDFHMNIAKAIEVPRIHDQWLPDEIYSEPFGIPEDVKINLIKMGYKFSTPRLIGLAEGIMIDQNDNRIFGASDPRGNGLARGY